MGKVLDWNDGLRKRNSMNLYIVDFLPGFRYEFLCHVRDERKALELAFEASKQFTEFEDCDTFEKFCKECETSEVDFCFLAELIRRSIVIMEDENVMLLDSGGHDYVYDDDSDYEDFT